MTQETEPFPPRPSEELLCRWLAWTSLATLALAVATPAAVVRDLGEKKTELVWGFQILMSGWLGAFSLQFGWYALPPLLSGIDHLRKGRWREASYKALLAVLLASSSLTWFFSPLMDDEAGHRDLALEHPHVGFFLWYGAIWALAATLLVRRLSGKFPPLARTAAAGFLLGCAVLGTTALIAAPTVRERARKAEVGRREHRQQPAQAPIASQARPVYTIEVGGPPGVPFTLLIEESDIEHRGDVNVVAEKSREESGVTPARYSAAGIFVRGILTREPERREVITATLLGAEQEILDRKSTSAERMSVTVSFGSGQGR